MLNLQIDNELPPVYVDILIEGFEMVHCTEDWGEGDGSWTVHFWDAL